MYGSPAVFWRPSNGRGSIPVSRQCSSPDPCLWSPKPGGCYNLHPAMSLSYVRSLVITDPLIILATLFMGTLSLLVSIFDRHGRAQHRVARIWSRTLLAVSRVTVRVQGLDKLDPQ